MKQGDRRRDTFEKNNKGKRGFMQKKKREKKKSEGVKDFGTTAAGPSTKTHERYEKHSAIMQHNTYSK